MGALASRSSVDLSHQEFEVWKFAHAGSRTRVTSMGGLYDAATLHALLIMHSEKTCKTVRTDPDASRFYGKGIAATRTPGTRHAHHRRAEGRRPPPAHLAAPPSQRPTSVCVGRRPPPARLAASTPPRPTSMRVGRRPATARLAASTSPRPTSICVRHLPWEELRMPGVEPGSQAWEACMMPLHYMRFCDWAIRES